MSEAEFLKLFIDYAVKQGRLEQGDYVDFIREFELQRRAALAEDGAATDQIMRTRMGV